MSMNVLIVYAHPREESLNRSILEVAVKTFEKNGHHVTVRDLYALNFNPVLSKEETIHIVDGKFVRDNTEYPDDVKVEQEYIKNSDLLVYIYPVWWNGFPSILKGYVERVFSYGFAYSFESDEPRQAFAGKKAFFIHTTGQPQDTASAQELTKVIKQVTSGWIFNANDVEVIDHLVYGRIPYLDADELRAVLTDVETHLESLR